MLLESNTKRQKMEPTPQYFNDVTLEKVLHEG